MYAIRSYYVHDHVLIEGSGTDQEQVANCCRIDGVLNGVTARGEVFRHHRDTAGTTVGEKEGFTRLGRAAIVAASDGQLVGPVKDRVRHGRHDFVRNNFV